MEEMELQMPKGLFGFEEYKSWVLEDSGAKPFLVLRAKDSGPSFYLLDPFLVCKDYEIDVDDEVLKSIGIQSPEDVLVLTIITMGGEKKVTTNLAGPIIINRKTLVAIQAVVLDSRWDTKYDIVKAMGGAGC